jgi:hypothetical protein
MLHIATKRCGALGEKFTKPIAPAELAGRLSELGWHFDVRQTDHYFLYGSGHVQLK